MTHRQLAAMIPAIVLSGCIGQNGQITLTVTLPGAQAEAAAVLTAARTVITNKYPLGPPPMIAAALTAAAAAVQGFQSVTADQSPVQKAQAAIAALQGLIDALPAGLIPANGQELIQLGLGFLSAYASQQGTFVAPASATVPPAAAGAPLSGASTVQRVAPIPIVF